MSIKRIIFLLTIVISISSCKTSSKIEYYDPDSLVNAYLECFGEKDYKTCDKMLSEHYKRRFLRAENMSYLEFYDNESYRQRVNNHGFKIVHKEVKRDAFYYKITYFVDSNKSPKKKGEILVTLRVVKEKNRFLVDNVIFNRWLKE